MNTSNIRNIVVGIGNISLGLEFDSIYFESKKNLYSLDNHSDEFSLRGHLFPMKELRCHREVGS